MKKIHYYCELFTSLLSLAQRRPDHVRRPDVVREVVDGPVVGPLVALARPPRLAGRVGSVALLPGPVAKE